ISAMPTSSAISSVGSMETPSSPVEDQVWSAIVALRQGRGEHLPDVLDVLGDDAEGVGSVVLAAERAGVAQLEGAADHLAVVDVAVLQRQRGTGVGAGGRVVVARVVLDVPEVRMGQDLLEDVLPGL